MRRALTLAALALTGAGCVSASPAPDRSELIRRILASTVQLRSERDGSLRRAASGVVVAFPWGQRFTVVRGIVSQVATLTDVTGPARMVSASVSYGSSGGGVFDAQSGELVGIVEGYRTAKVAIPEMKERVLEVPVAGETTLIPAPAILRFLVDSGLSNFLPR